MYPPDFSVMPLNAIQFQGDLVISELKSDGTGGSVARMNADDSSNETLIFVQSIFSVICQFLILANSCLEKSPSIILNLFDSSLFQIVFIFGYFMLHIPSLISMLFMPPYPQLSLGSSTSTT
jgi:hypothetical protein